MTDSRATRQQRKVRCKGIACDARPKARADLRGAGAKPPAAVRMETKERYECAARASLAMPVQKPAPTCAARALNPCRGEDGDKREIRVRCKGIACDARPKARADLRGAGAKPLPR